MDTQIRLSLHAAAAPALSFALPQFIRELFPDDSLPPFSAPAGVAGHVYETSTAPDTCLKWYGRPVRIATEGASLGAWPFPGEEGVFSSAVIGAEPPMQGLAGDAEQFGNRLHLAAVKNCLNRFSSQVFLGRGGKTEEGEGLHKGSIPHGKKDCVTF